jgi:hypothetical protein
MRTRIFIAFLVLLALAAGQIRAEEPQLAYRILSTYVDQRQAKADDGNLVGGLVLAGAGGLLLSGAATTWFYGDDISRAATGQPIDPELRNNMTLGLGIGGLATIGVSAGLLAAKPHDWRAEYAEVFEEEDPQVQEALAVASLRDIAVKGKQERIRGAFSNLLAPVLFAVIKAGVNSVEGKEWSDGIVDGLRWNIFSIVGGASSLLGSSEGERLYDKYLAGREALYGPSSRLPAGGRN